MNRTTQLLLAVIALGLWANASASWLRPAHAQTDTLLRSIDTQLSSIDTNIRRLVRGGSGRPSAGLGAALAVLPLSVIGCS